VEEYFELEPPHQEDQPFHLQAWSVKQWSLASKWQTNMVGKFSAKDKPRKNLNIQSLQWYFMLTLIIFKCQNCNVGLCFDPCLRIFHTKLQFSDQHLTGKSTLHNCNIFHLKLFLCLTKHHTMETYGGMDVQLHVFITSALDGGKWSASHPSYFTPGEGTYSTHWIGGRVGPRANLDVVARRKILRPCWELNSSHPACSQALFWLSYPNSPIFIM
jgi:hypothetical protein